MTTAARGTGEKTCSVHVILHEADEGGYWAEVIELPGCVGQGETEEETIRNIEQSFRSIFRSYADDGEEIPHERSATVKRLELAVLA